MSYSEIGYNEFLTREAPSISSMVGDVQTYEEVESKFGVGSVGGNVISENSIRTENLVVGSKSWSSNVSWSTSVANQLSWSSHTLFLADSQSAAISSGSVAITTSGLRYYIYYQKGGTTYSSTNDFQVALSDEKIHVATAQVDTFGKVTIFPKDTFGTVISGDQITTGTIQSTNGLSYINLNENRTVYNDGTNDRIVIGTLP